MNNIYNAIQNLYNMDKTTWQEVLAELYNVVSNIENKFDLFEVKFGSLLGEQVTRELKKMYDDGSLASLINDVLLKDINKKVDTFKTEVNEQLGQVDTFKTEVNEQLDNIIPIVHEAISKSSDAIGKANNPIETILSSGQKIPFALWDDEAIEAISGTTNIITNAGYDKNKGVNYPLKALTRDGKLSSSSTKIKNGILDIKINGAKKGKYYRLEWLGNGVELVGGNRLDILLSEYDKEMYSSSSSSNKRNLITLNDGLGLNKRGDTTGVITRRYTSLYDNISIEVTYDGGVIGSYIALNQENGEGYSFIIDESCYSYAEQIYPIVCKKMVMLLRLHGNIIIIKILE